MELWSETRWWKKNMLLLLNVFSVFWWKLIKLGIGRQPPVTTRWIAFKPMSLCVSVDKDGPENRYRTQHISMSRKSCLYLMPSCVYFYWMFFVFNSRAKSIVCDSGRFPLNLLYQSRFDNRYISWADVRSTVMKLYVMDCPKSTQNKGAIKKTK